MTGLEERLEWLLLADSVEKLGVPRFSLSPQKNDLHNRSVLDDPVPGNIKPIPKNRPKIRYLSFSTESAGSEPSSCCSKAVISAWLTPTFRRTWDASPGAVADEAGQRGTGKAYGAAVFASCAPPGSDQSSPKSSSSSTSGGQTSSRHPSAISWLIRPSPQT